MMEKREFAFFKRLSLFGVGVVMCSSLLLDSCSTAPVQVKKDSEEKAQEDAATTAAPTTSAQPVLSEPRAYLLSQQIEAGSATWLRVTLPPPYPEDYPAEKIDAAFEGTKLPFYRVSDLPRVYETMVGVLYERKPGPAQLRVKIPSFKKEESGEVQDLTVAFTVVAGSYSSEILHVDGRRVHPKEKKDLVRILKEQAEIGHLYRSVTLSKYWKDDFVMPIESAVTSPFGTRRLYNGELKSYHTGLDLRASIGTPVFSSAAGKIVMAKNLFYTGNTIILDHGYGILTLYAHLSKLQVEVGDRVEAHELLGLSGKTGRVNGPHLHWQAIVHGVKVNPLALLVSSTQDATW